MADFPGAQFLRRGRREEVCIVLSFDEAFRRIAFFNDPFDVVDGVEPDIGGHQGNQHVLTANLESCMPTRLPLQVRDAFDPVVGDQFEASGMQSGKHPDRHAGIDRRDMNRHVVHTEIRLAACDPHPLIDLLSPCT